MQIIKQDPPAKSGNVKYHWGILLEPLMKEPGVWFWVMKYKKATTAGSTALRIRTKKIRSMPPGRWEAIARGVKVYVRYMGGDHESDRR